VLVHRPSLPEELAAAREMVEQHLTGITPMEGTVIGVAGTWTSLAGIHLESEEIHLTELSAADVAGLVGKLAGLTIEETADLPGFDPARAPVILAGAIIAEGAMAALAAERILTSNHDLLDGVVQQLVDFP
jgi:exopolyphosphatase/guanosine-5'-triphosphate,3'-diphosphate pyrophosphatase